MKQRVITAVVLLALLAVVVWQIYTPLFIIVIAFLSAVAANEIMKCAKVSNKFIVILGTAVGAIIPFTSSENIMQPWISAEKWSHFISIVPPLAFAVIVIIAFFLAMIFDYEHTKFEDVAVSIVASIAVPYGFSKLSSAFILFSTDLLPLLVRIRVHSLAVWRSASIKWLLIFHLKRLKRVLCAAFVHRLFLMLRQCFCTTNLHMFRSASIWLRHSLLQSRLYRFSV